jgi:hypothetical protein
VVIEEGNINVARLKPHHTFDPDDSRRQAQLDGAGGPNGATILVFGLSAKEVEMAQDTRGGGQGKDEKDEKDQRDEKEEKDEKDQRGEKEEKDEKGRGEKVRNDPLSVMAWAAVLVWAGLVLLAENLWPKLLGGWEAWSIILIGAGVIFLLEALVQLLRPEYRRPIGGTVIFAVILMAIGLGDALNWVVIWPIALIVIGAVLLARAVVRRD